MQFVKNVLVYVFGVFMNVLVYVFHYILHSPLKFLIEVQKAVLTELLFKMQFVKNVLVYVFGV